MNKVVTVLASLSLSFLFLFCGAKEKKENYSFGNYDLSSGSGNRITLSGELDEISGIVYTGQGKLLAHNDEAGIIYELNIENGQVTGEHVLGNEIMSDDFEDIAAAGDRVFLVTSEGTIYETSLGTSEYKSYKTSLNSKNDVEGMVYDKENNALLLACKGDAGTGNAKEKAIYSFSLNSYQLEGNPRFVLLEEQITDKLGTKSFSPSGITINSHGNIFVISSNNRGIVELNPDGKIVNIANLSKDNHRQPEGITFVDGTLLISDEASGGKPTLTMYNSK